MLTARLVHGNPGDTAVVATPYSGNFDKYTQLLNQKGVRATAKKGENIITNGEGVIVTTYHQLKGLEFDHVVLTNLEDNAFPGWFLRECPIEDLEQEEAYLRRLLYVAITRARKSVTLVGGRPFCRFLSDIPAEYFDEI
jgi:superfamily I DNA/RNA helicase